jgi:nitrite reductase/ring-hydroxylating ferredoxin subunit
MSHGSDDTNEPRSCGECPLAGATGRRAFVRDAAAAIATALMALGASAREARALPRRTIAAVAVRGDERLYALPATDGVSIDKNESVIITRWQGKAYAFSLACPHQNTMLRWEQPDARFQCPKHHSKYRPDGSFIEGRATRGMDRFAVRREGDRLAVDLDLLYREDKDPAEWKAAVIQL